MTVSQGDGWFSAMTQRSDCESTFMMKAGFSTPPARNSKNFYADERIYSTANCQSRRPNSDQGPRFRNVPAAGALRQRRREQSRPELPIRATTIHTERRDRTASFWLSPLRTDRRIPSGSAGGPTCAVSTDPGRVNRSPTRAAVAEQIDRYVARHPSLPFS
jgi:hypothetical protein